MDKLFGVIADVGDSPGKGGDTFIDRLNCQITAFILVVFAIMVSTKHYVGDPISCWCPAHFASSHVDYANKVCWVTNTYHLPFAQQIPKAKATNVRRIGYYQWVALVLIAQAVCFYIPRVIWRILNKKSGIAVSTITEAAVQVQRATDSESRDKTLRYMTKHMGRFLHELNKKYIRASKCRGLWWSLYGNYLVILYVLIKVLYLTNVIGQFFLLNAFLSTSYNWYGFLVMARLSEGRDWTVSEHFPRVTMCDFEIRVLGNVQRYSVQCALPINLFNEIIYIFIWFWFVFIAAATAVSLVMWLGELLYRPAQIAYVRDKLEAMDKLDSGSKQFLRNFMCHYLRRDGVFLVHLVARTASDVIAAELLCGLWDHFKGAEYCLSKKIENEERRHSLAGSFKDSNNQLAVQLEC